MKLPDFFLVGKHRFKIHEDRVPADIVPKYRAEYQLNFESMIQGEDCISPPPHGRWALSATRHSPIAMTARRWR